MKFLEKLFPSKDENNKEQKEEARVVKTPIGYKVEKNGILSSRNATPEEIEKAREQGNILDLTESDEDNKSPEVPKPGDIFPEQGRPRTVNKARVVVKPTKEQLDTWEKKQENE